MDKELLSSLKGAQLGDIISVDGEGWVWPIQVVITDIFGEFNEDRQDLELEGVYSDQIGPNYRGTHAPLVRCVITFEPAMDDSVDDAIWIHLEDPAEPTVVTSITHID